jgi:Protein of unknown function (DUF2958)
MKLITEAQYAALLANGRAACTNCDIDPKPVVKFFTPGGYSRWLLTEIDPNGTDRTYGLCDPGDGRPYLGYVHLNDLEGPHGRYALLTVRDDDFVADKPLSVYAEVAYTRGLIAT